MLLLVIQLYNISGGVMAKNKTKKLQKEKKTRKILIYIMLTLLAINIAEQAALHYYQQDSLISIIPFF